MGFQWTVRVSQRLQSRSLQNGESRRFGLVQIFLEASKIRGVSQTLVRQSLYMTGAVAACFDGYGNRLFSRTHRQHHIQNLELNLLYTFKKSLLCVRLLRHSMRAADVASTARSMSLGRWLEVACFSSVKIYNVLGPHLFPSVTTHAKKSLCLSTTVLHRAKKSLCNRSQFRTLFLPHRFIQIRPSHQRPVSIEFLTICRIPGFPKSKQNRKSCGNVRIWRKRAAVRRKNHNNLNKSFGMNVARLNDSCHTSSLLIICRILSDV